LYNHLRIRGGFPEITIFVRSKFKFNSTVFVRFVKLVVCKALGVPVVYVTDPMEPTP
jgi:hypothetical protein